MPASTRKRKVNSYKPQATSSTTQTTSSTTQTTSSTRKSSCSGVEYKDDDPFYQAFDQDEAESDGEEDEDSDYAGRKKRRTSKNTKIKKRKAIKRPGPAPEAPEISEDEDIEFDEDDSVWSHRGALTHSNKPTVASPRMIKIQINGASDSPTTINLNLADLLRANGLTHINVEAQATASTVKQIVGDEADKVGKMKLGFLDVPRELRNKVYQYVFAAKGPILFDHPDNFRNSAGFLRTCRTVAAEGTEVLYGENSFHFSRNSQKRGKYWDKEWREVGFKDVRRFLTDIGPGNVSKVKYVSFLLEDAAPYATPSLTVMERRFANDAILQDVFNIIGTNTVLRKLAILFGGRAAIASSDYHFLKALARVKCNEFRNIPSVQGHISRIHENVFNTLKSVIVKKENAHEIDEAKVKKVPMHMEKPTKKAYSGNW
jgi:hypothetical protein